jgi:glycosyltransferase involved in cell wall biosynthesis
MRITFVQYGDYAEAVHRFAQGGLPTYYAQKYSVDYVAGLTQMADAVNVITLASRPLEEDLPNGVHAIGLRLWYENSIGDVVRAVAGTNPTHLIMCTPLGPVIEWGYKHDVRTLALFADSFESPRLRDRLRNHFLAAALNRQALEWVGNHNVNASLSLSHLGVRPTKIIPWDWPPLATPEQFNEKEGLPDPSDIRLLYVGYVSAEKGVGDCIKAVGILRERECPVRLDVVGQGPGLRNLQRLAEHLRLEPFVSFLGVVPNHEIIPMMRRHDAVVVASHHNCPEGLPMTVYETFCSRTPLIASDHPMFRRKVQHEVSALVFRAGDAASLADAVMRLVKSGDLYRALSRNSLEAWRRLQCPVKWGDLVSRWIRDTPADRLWLNRHTLAAYPYY